MSGLRPADLVAGPGWTPPEAPSVIVIGRLSAEFDQGELRAVCIDGYEVINRLYVAVRDVNWGTLAAPISDTRARRTRRHVTIEFACSQADDAIGFDWRGRIRLHSAGSVDFEMDGAATKAFDYGRIGLNVLLPATFAGLPYRITTPSGFHGTLFPQGEIGPQPLIADEYYPLEPAFTGLTVVTNIGELQLNLSGDLFEIEDQRNWTDYSFKVYSTPMTRASLHAESGHRIHQRACLVGPPPLAGMPARRGRRRRAYPVVTVGLGDAEFALPEVGLVETLGDRPPSESERQLLRRLHLDHLRVDLPTSAQFDSKAREAAALASSLGCKLELAVHLKTGSSESDLEDLAGTVDALANIRRVLLFHDDEQVTAQLWTIRFRQALAGRVPVYGGTNMYFADVNRTRPDPATCDGVAFSVNSQVHAFDNRSVMETVRAHRDIVRSAKCTFAASVPVAVSPLTLRPRFNPDAVDPTKLGTAPPGEVPDRVDLRQSSLFCAAWTVGSLKYLCEAGADSLTYFGTVGWEGVVERTDGSPVPSGFPSATGGVYPCYHVFRTLGRRKRRRIVASHSSDPQSIVALATRDRVETTIMVANLTSSERRVHVRGVGSSSGVLRLDQSTVVQAMEWPEAFAGGAEELSRPGLLTLGPYAVLVCTAARSVRREDSA